MSCFDKVIRAKFTDVVRGIEDMHPYQIDEAVPFLRENPFSALLVDMGLGKTVSTATVIAEVVLNFVYPKVLIIGPRRVVTETWPTEFRLWEHTAPLNCSLIHVLEDDPRLDVEFKRLKQKFRLAGESPQEATRLANRGLTKYKETLRIQAARSAAGVHLISRDWIDWLVDYWGPRWPYRMVVIDESSSFKDHKSVGFKKLSKVRQTPGCIERLHLLTATPASETYEHLFAQMYLLDTGERLGKHITKYRDRFFAYNRYSMKYKLREGAEEEILEKISDICLVMKAKDYLNRDEPNFVERTVTLHPWQMDLYRELEEHFVVTLPDGSEVEAETAAALSQKLLQMASGVLYETFLDGDLEEGDLKKVRKVHKIHEHKLEMLQQIVDETQGNPLLVAYHHRASLDRLKAAFPNAVVMDRDGKCVKPWNAKKIPMLLIHPKSGGHGLNMQKGGHNVVFFDLPWSLELFQQLIGRVDRQGQEMPVVVQLLIAKGTLDEYVWECLRNKDDAQEKLFVILKRKIREHRKRMSAGIK